MNDAVTTLTISSDADLNFGDAGYETFFGSSTLLEASQKDGFDSIAEKTTSDDIVSDWQAGFMLGAEGGEIVEASLLNSEQPTTETSLSNAAYYAQSELLYMEEEEFVEVFQADQNSQETFFDVDALMLDADLPSFQPTVTEEIKIFLNATASEEVDLDTIFDVMGLAGNRMTDERLYSNDSFVDINKADDISAKDNSVFSHASVDDLDFGQMIDQMADQTFISNES